MKSICINCKNEKRKDYHNFCSRKCKSEYITEKFLCKECGCEVYRKPYQLKNKSIFCSNKCWQKYYSHKNGKIISHIRKGKKYEEIYGKEKALKIKNMLINSHKGIQIGEKHPLYKKIDENKLIRLYNDDKYSIKKLSEIFAVSRRIIRSRLIKNNIILRKHIVSDETKTRQKQAKLGKSNIFRLGKKHTEEAKQKIKKHRSEQIFPIKDTKIEMKIQSFLDNLKIEYYTHKYISEITHSYQCDIFIPSQEKISQKIIIECDGDYWHDYPNGKEIDHIRTKELIEKGYKVIRLWENKIKVLDLNNFMEVLKLHTLS